MGLRPTFCVQESSSAQVMAGFVGWRTLDFADTSAFDHAAFGLK
jgi:hypothetical protein